MKKRDASLSDADVRPALRAHLRAAHSHDPDTVVLEELGICRAQVRVDLAVVNGFLHGYEIKSDRDSLRRLSVQVAFYGRVLDRATLVVGHTHLDEATDLVPDWWEILLICPAGDGMRFKPIRRARRNFRRDPRALVELLWLDQALALLDHRDAARGVRGKPRRVVWDRVCECLNIEEIAAAVRFHLKARGASPERVQPL